MTHDSMAVLNNLLENIKKVIVDKDEVIKKVIACWVAGGHVLLEDVPGTGKTMLARSLACSVAAPFKRVQFTPDLLPLDMIGSAFFNRREQKFEFRKGPLFTTIFLADEINRATPKTQAALLEAMSEKQISAEGQTRKLDPLFFTIATQNPVEQVGTFPLPEAQLDRFMIKLSLGYPSLSEEMRLLKSVRQTHPIEDLKPVEDAKRILLVRQAAQGVGISDEVYHYALAIITRTRTSDDLLLGASSRAAIDLTRAAAAMALFEGLSYLKPSHIYALAPAILAHRLVLTPQARISGKTPDNVLKAILAETKVPSK